MTFFYLQKKLFVRSPYTTYPVPVCRTAARIFPKKVLAPRIFFLYFMSTAHINVHIQEVSGMSKNKDIKKDKKTPPQKTTKEKRKEKQEKKKNKAQ